ncbi:hypothetical protein QP157_06895 [Sphingomonas sp. LR61]|uniref:hypothetical protein n=1 Tax=Sphingomonas sp. LR61 TaxID=3050234 RepID=UPI002FE089DD
MTHADEAARLAKKIEKDSPAIAGVIHALLAIAEGASGGDAWHKLDSYEDLPWQGEQEYVFEYADGEQAKWLLSSDNLSGVFTYYAPGDRTRWVGPNDLADQCVRWRYA